MNLYYMNQGQVENEEVIKRKKAKEREKRIKQNKANASSDDFDLDTEAVIRMTNKNKIKKEEEAKRKLTQEERRRKKRNKKIKAIIKFLTIITIIAGGTTFAMVSPIFNIANIEVFNNEQVTKETIISLSEIQLGENIFRFKAKDASEKIKENAYIENVEIHRSIPNVIKIELEERKHSYSIDFLGKFAYINNQGYILEISDSSKQKIVIQGISTEEEQMQEGKRLNKKDLEKLEDIIKIINVAKEYELDTKITSIDIKDKNEYSIYLEEERKKVHLGDESNLSNKMLYVNSILEEEKGKAGDIFVNGDINNKFRIYFRESLNV